jgi:hypothetical protein
MDAGHSKLWQGWAEKPELSDVESCVHCSVVDMKLWVGTLQECQEQQGGKDGVAVDSRPNAFV